MEQAHSDSGAGSMVLSVISFVAEVSLLVIGAVRTWSLNSLSCSPFRGSPGMEEKVGLRSCLCYESAGLDAGRMHCVK